MSTKLCVISMPVGSFVSAVVDQIMQLKLSILPPAHLAARLSKAVTFFAFMRAVLSPHVLLAGAPPGIYAAILLLLSNEAASGSGTFLQFDVIDFCFCDATRGTRPLNLCSSWLSQQWNEPSTTHREVASFLYVSTKSWVRVRVRLHVITGRIKSN